MALLFLLFGNVMVGNTRGSSGALGLNFLNVPEKWWKELHRCDDTAAPLRFFKSFQHGSNFLCSPFYTRVEQESICPVSVR